MRARENTKIATTPTRATGGAPRISPRLAVEGGGQGVRAQTGAGRVPVRRLIAALMSAWLAVSPLVTLRAAYAGPIADGAAPASSRPQVTATQSGVPLVNIAAPNGAGASYNRYQRFDVDSVGLILNNSTRAASSQLGGQIGANPNFNGRSAHLIVNEVTSALPSKLNGPLAIFGDAAKLVIANPNGITCNGCGFLNTPQVQLTTGRVQFLTAPGGALTTPETGAAVTFDVRGGTIRVEGQGLASPLERLDLIAQMLDVDAPVTISGALNLLAGRQTVAAEDLAVSANGADNSRAAIQSDDPAASEFAVDASVFGAMTAGQIRIVSTPAGMGVRADSRLAAQAGDLLISADGDVRLRQATASRDAAVVAAGALTNGEQLAAARNLSLGASALDNRNARISAGENADVTVSALDNAGGTLQAAGQLDMALPGAGIDLAAAATGTLAGGSALSLAAREIANTGSFQHGAALSLTATDRIANTGTLTAGGDLSLAADVIDNRGVMQTLGRLFLTGTSASNAAGARMEAASDIALSAVSLDNHGDIVSQRDLIASVTTLTNSGLIHAGNDAVLHLGAASNNAGGTLTAARDLYLSTDVTAAVGGSVGAGRDLFLAFDDYTHGNDTDFRAGRDLSVSAANFVNTSLLEAPNDLALAITHDLTSSGQIIARNDIALDVGGRFTNSAGIVEAGRDLTIATADLSNGGSTTTAQYVAYTLQDYVNNVLTYVTDPVAQLKLFNEYPPDWFWKNSRVTLNNRYSLYLDSGLDAPVFYLTLTRPGSPGTLAAGRDLRVTASGTVTNRASILTAGRDVSLSAAQFDNLAGQTIADGNIFAGGGGHEMKAFGNASATVQAGGTVVITAAAQTNTGLIQANAVYLGGNLVNGIADYNVQTPAPRLPDAVINLGTQNLPAGSLFTPGGATLFSSASRLALLAPIGPDSLNALLPPELRAGNTPYLLDGWLEQQALRQAALNETGRVLFLASLDYENEDGLSPETRQRQLLYAAAARFALSEGLRLGVALSSEQIARLHEPLLWYVEQTVTGPDGKPYPALVPRLYLPEASRAQLVNLGGGSLIGNDVSLTGETVTNTGFLQAKRLTVNAEELRNEKRSAYWGRGTENVKGGVIEYWGDRVQPGGFISAAELSLNVNRIHSVSGAFYADGKEISPDLARSLGPNYTRQENQDHRYSRFHADSSAQTKRIAAMAAAIAVSVWVGPQISGWVGNSFGTTAGSTFAAGGMGNITLSGALTGMASTTLTGAITGNLSLDNILKSGLTSGLTAGLTQWAGQALSNSTLLNTQQVGDALKAGETATQLTDKLIGYTVRAGVTAGVNQAAYGQDAGSFGGAFVQSFVASGAADAARFTGDNTGPNKPLGEMGSPQHVLAHAALGCAGAALSGNDCAAGAIGGGTSAFAGSLMPDPESPTQRALMAGALTFIGGATAQAAGYDGATAAQAAGNEALNNRLLHQKEITLIKARAKDFARQVNGGKEPTLEQIAQAETRLLDQADRNVNQQSDLRLDGEANRYLTDLKRELAKAWQGTLPGGGQYFFASPDQYFNDRMYAETLNTPTGQQAYRQIQAGQTGQYLPGYYYKQGIADANQEASRQAAAGAITAGAILAPWAVGACLTNPVACNQIGLTTAEVFSEGGVVAGGAVAAEKGGLNLFKWAKETTTKPGGWREGDFFLYLSDLGGAKENWAQNAGRLREQMRQGKPIFDSYRDPVTGLQIPAQGFLRAERNLLESHGWRYDARTGAYYAPRF